jgi:hypothetical protein
VAAALYRVAPRFAGTVGGGDRWEGVRERGSSATHWFVRSACACGRRIVKQRFEAGPHWEGRRNQQGRAAGVHEPNCAGACWRGAGRGETNGTWRTSLSKLLAADPVSKLEGVEYIIDVVAGQQRATSACDIVSRAAQQGQERQLGPRANHHGGCRESETGQGRPRVTHEKSGAPLAPSARRRQILPLEHIFCSPNTAIFGCCGRKSVGKSDTL